MFSCRLQDEIHGADCHLHSSLLDTPLERNATFIQITKSGSICFRFELVCLKVHILSFLYIYTVYDVCEVPQFLLSGKNSSDHSSASMSCMRINTFAHKHLNMNNIAHLFYVNATVFSHPWTVFIVFSLPMCSMTQFFPVKVVDSPHLSVPRYQVKSPLFI